MVEQFTVGGPLDAEDPTYIDRDADTQLYQALKAGKFCYVLESRQTGKSSLCNRIIDKLNRDEIRNVYFELNEIDIENAEIASWYLSQLDLISDGLKLGINIHEWRKSYQSLSPLRIFGKFFEEILLEKVQKNIVIFIDEIDSILSLPFSTNDFFAFIRSCYNKKKYNKNYERLTFCLLGVASPNNLIKNKKRTPFNIGTGITLKPFTLNQVQVLIEGLKVKFSQPEAEAAMTEILKWTGGQPFLTQKLCQLMTEELTENNFTSVQGLVKFVVESMIIETWEVDDNNREHLPTIRDRLLCLQRDDEKKNIEDRDEERSFQLLSLYQKILSGIVTANDGDEYQIDLKLTGVVLRGEDGNLRVYNPIYEKVFNREWIDKQIADIRPYSEKFKAWLEASEELKQRYLLYGDELEYALKWAEDKSISIKEHNFLNASKNFSQRIQDNFPENSDYQAIIKAVLAWTGGVKIFNEFILKTAKPFTKTIARGEEYIWIEAKLISKIIKNNILIAKDENIQKRFQEITDNIDNILKDPTIDTFLLLSTYQEILEKEQVEFNNILEQQKLIEMCLAIKENNRLKISNKIYCLIFDKKWFQRQSASFLPPYVKRFQAWQASGCQDESLLLKGEDLQKALDWIQNKDKLSESELEFIITSVVWEMWQFDSREEKNEAVRIIQNFLPELREKPNYSYTFIQEILKYTSSEPFLLEGCFQLIVQNDSLLEDLENLVTSKKKADSIIEFLKNKLIDKTDNSYGIDSIFLLHINKNYILSSYLLENDSHSLYFNNFIEIGRQNIKNLLDETQTLTEKLSIKSINLFTKDKIIYFVVLPGEILICLVVDLQKDPLDLNIQKFITDNQYKITDLLTS